MGRTTLDAALTEVPELKDRIMAAERELQRVIDLLAPYVKRGTPPDPDLAFQVKILQQALREISWMLRPEAS